MTTFQKLIGISALVIFAILFYWFQIRPAQIRTECANKKSEYVKNIKTHESFQTFILTPQGQKALDDVYENCLHSQGL